MVGEGLGEVRDWFWRIGETVVVEEEKMSSFGSVDHELVWPD